MIRIRFYLFCTSLLLSVLQLNAHTIDDIHDALQQSSVSQLQEKVYIHTDNQCYFVGDTLWYKAYVVQAGTLQPTNMSRLLYVELLSPDGLLVERQTIAVNAQGYTCGQFALKDSLYSGYYELRAYTRWMLNFNVHLHRYSIIDRWAFFNRAMADDFFRVWEGLYSRVLPVYSKPEKPGDYDVRSMYQRPKTRIPKPKKDDLFITFYPEGGHLLKGVANHVAFEVTNQYGEAVDITGEVRADGLEPITIKTDYMGRGSFVVTPGSHRIKAHFKWHGDNYSESLPKAEEQGVAIHIDNGKLHLQPCQMSQQEYGISVLCRGVLKHFQKLSDLSAPTTIELPLEELPTGVNDVTLFDANGQIVADRLFFVNHHDQDANLITTDIDPRQTYEPYERIEVPVQCPVSNEENGPTVFSISIHDTNTKEPTYDNGNIMTDMLLSSDLRGFIAYPAHYFEADDETHRYHLDLLMMVQGWRKYKWNELTNAERPLRYQPEKGLSVEGHVYKMIPINPVEFEEIPSWFTGVGMIGAKPEDPTATEDDPFADNTETSESTLLTNDGRAVSADAGFFDYTSGSQVDTRDLSNFDYGSMNDISVGLRTYSGTLRRDVIVEAEIIVDNQIIGATQLTNGGHYLFTIPPFYGQAYLNMKAYKENDSIRKNMLSRRDAKVLDEDAFPDYYVKRDLFFPRYTHDYNYYEKHQPDVTDELVIDTVSDFSMENDVHQLASVNVKGHRRGKRAIDWKKPAFVMDAYDMYNELTDYGLSYGKLDMRLFPVQVCRYLYGNMNRYRMFNVDGRLEGSTYYRNYSPYATDGEVERMGVFRANRTPQWYLSRLKLKRLQDIRVFSDFEPRTEDSTMVESLFSPDATVDMVLFPDDGEQPTFRDRHILFQGVNQAEEFYQPDYSQWRPSEPNDYRRTLYWNPNAVANSEGQFVATFYNNSKPTRIKMSAAGVTNDGKLLHSK